MPFYQFVYTWDHLTWKNNAAFLKIWLINGMTKSWHVKLENGVELKKGWVRWKEFMIILNAIFVDGKLPRKLRSFRSHMKDAMNRRGQIRRFLTFLVAYQSNSVGAPHASQWRTNPGNGPFRLPSKIGW